MHVASRVTLCSVFLLALIRPLAVRSQTGSPATAAALTRSGEVSERFCERRCAVEALSGEELPPRSVFCGRLCPDYAVEPEFLDPDAQCTTCPGTCDLCNCATGQCVELGVVTDIFLDNVTAEVFVPLPEDAAPPGFTEEADEAQMEGTAVALVAGSPTTSLRCSRCRPKKTCRRLWFCR